MLRLLEGITINWYLSIVNMTHENIILLIEWFQFVSLPNNVAMADNINIFKKRLDKFWSSYDFIYLFRAQPLDTKSVK